MDNTYRGNAVDAYLLEVNAVAINTTEARATITLLPNITDITINLRASNCFGLTPVTTFHLHQGKMTRMYYQKKFNNVANVVMM